MLLAFALIGCALVDDAAHDDAIDRDGDGLAWPEDCAPDNPGVQRLTFYADVDVDGFGDPADAIEACEVPAGYVANADDCDDADDAVNPDAVEVCGGGDEDCDGDVDDADDSVTDKKTFYADGDGDGFGTEATKLEACALEGSFVRKAGDCDDAEADVNPDHAEVCSNGIDDDCDGTNNDCVPLGTLDLTTRAAAILEGPFAGGDVGLRVASLGDVDGDGVTDVLVGSHFSGIQGDGVAHLASGPLQGAVDLANVPRIDGEPLDAIFEEAVGTGDVTSDGIGDFVVTRTGFLGTQAAMLFEGPLTGVASLDDALATYRVTGSRTIDDVAFGPFLDSAGPGELVVGSPANVFNSDNEVHVLRLEDTGTHELGDRSEVVVSDQDLDRFFGESLALVGDLDSDGISELVVTDSWEGLWVIPGGLTSGSYTATDVHLGRILGPRNHVAAVGDFTGDGAPDVLGKSDPDDELFLFSPPMTGQLTGQDAELTIVESPTIAFVTDGTDRFDGGDIDGDGVSDIVIGGDEHDGAGTDAGAVWILYGPQSGVVTLANADAVIYGETGLDGFGADVAVDDLDGNGFADILVGAPGSDRGAADGGAAYVILGGNL